MTDAAACAVLSVGKAVVAIAALQELRLLLDAVGARGSDPNDASMPSKEGCDAPKESVDPNTDTAVPAPRADGGVDRSGASTPRAWLALLVVLKGYGHYAVYRERAFSEVMQATLAWYRQHLPAREA